MFFRINSPLEQFDLLSLISFKIFNLDFSVTNSSLINIFTVLTVLGFWYGTTSKKNSSQESLLYATPNSWQTILEYILEIPARLVFDMLAADNEKYVPILSVLFNYILFSNLIGLIPYTFSPTSHGIVTFTISFSVCIGIAVTTLKKHEMVAFSLFLPANSNFFLALILVPIEFISYFARPISLGMRLFINVLAGHSLLKVLLGFSWCMLLLKSVTSLGFIAPIAITVVLFMLELGVAFIQTYVFILLICIYIQDVS
jgi:ATP synthase subunit 6